MPRIKPTRHPGAAESVHVQTRDASAEVFPVGTPLAPDGQVAENEDVPVEEVRRVGAVSAESGRRNKALGRLVHRKQNGDTGKTVRWNSDDALDQFDAVRAMWGTSDIWISVQRVDSSPPEQYPLVRMAGMRSSADLYNYIEKCHGFREPGTYQVVFKDALERGRGKVHMPDRRALAPVQEATPQQQNQPQFPPQPPTPWGYPPPGYGYPPAGGFGYPSPPPYPHAPPGYPPPGYPPPGYGPPSYMAPEQPSAPPAPSPPAQPPVFVMPPYPQPPAPPMAPPGPPPGITPEQAYAQYATSTELQRMQQMLQQALIQNAQIIGEVQATRQAGYNPPQPSPPMPVPTMYGYPQAPPPPAPPPAPAPPAPPPAPGPVATIQNAAQQVTSIFEAMQGLQSMVGRFATPGGMAPPPPPVLEIDDPLPLPVEDPSPIITHTVGSGDKSFPVSIFRDTGKVNVGATLIGMVPVVGSFAKDVFDAVGKIQERQQAGIAALADVRRQNQQRVVDMQLPPMTAPPPPVYVPPPAPPPPPPPPSPTSGASLIPWSSR